MKIPSNIDSILRQAFMLLLPIIISTAYLTFCWNVYYRPVRIDGHTLTGSSLENIGSIKSGVTTINILVVSLALWPIKGLFNELKCEEFFRSVKRASSAKGNRDQGVDLVTANSVSAAPMLGTLDMLLIVLKRQCSPFFTVAFICGLIVLAVSSLAPAALSVREGFLDPGVVEIEVGAVLGSSVLDDPRTDSVSLRMKSYLGEAASITWAEAVLSANYSFSTPISPTESSPQYIVPLPVHLPPTVHAKWWTDAFVLRPSCNWYTTNITGTVKLEDFFKNGTTSMVSIPQLGVDVEIRYAIADYAHMLGPETFFMRYDSVVSGRYRTFNSTTGELARGGYSIWELSQSYFPYDYPEYDSPVMNLTYDTTGIPTFTVSSGDYLDTFHYSILVCSPNFTIETVEVKNDRNGLFVLPSSNLNTAPQVVRQGNLDIDQGDFFFAALFSELGEDTSPEFTQDVSGITQIQMSIAFGWDQVDSVAAVDTFTIEEAVLTPMPLSNITSMYLKYLQSAAKVYMTGALGTMSVPGVISEPVVVFTASLPYVVVSTILMVMLNTVHVLAFFRSRKGEVFRLIRVADVLLGESNVPRIMADFRNENGTTKDEDLGSVFEAASKGCMLKLDDTDRMGGARVLFVNDE